MTTAQITAATGSAVVVFWIVGAYNRMVSLRNALVARFAAVDELFRQRHALLEDQIELLAAALASAGPRLEALRAAARCRARVRTFAPRRCRCDHEPAPGRRHPRRRTLPPAGAVGGRRRP